PRAALSMVVAGLSTLRNRLRTEGPQSVHHPWKCEEKRRKRAWQRPCSPARAGPMRAERNDFTLLAVGRTVHDVADAPRQGAIGYATPAHPMMSLAERVVALLVADFLTRPRDYECVSACPDCGTISFAWAPSHHASCAAYAPESTVVPKLASAPRALADVG